MKSGYFLETTSSWKCQELSAGDEGLSGSLPQWFNASVVCNHSGNWTASLNDTDVERETPGFNELSLVKTIVLSVMFVVAFTGNTATLMRMYRMRRRRSSMNLLITHLATADLFVTFFCNVTDAVWTATVQWLAGNAACKLIKFLQVGLSHCALPPRRNIKTCQKPNCVQDKFDFSFKIYISVN